MTTRLKQLASLQGECTSSNKRPYVALENLESWTGKLAEGTELPVRVPASTGMATAEPGDVLFGKLRPYLAKSWVVNQPVLASTELICMRPQSQVNPRWLGYLITSVPFVGWASATSDGTKMPRTSWEKINQYRTAVPQRVEQQAIADYLDTETARIDALISKKRHLIQLLTEKTRYKAHTLTTEGWNQAPLRRLVSKMKTGTTPPPGQLAELTGDDVAWYSPGDIGSFLEMRQPARTLSARAIEDGMNPLFPAESTLIVGIGATAGRVGHCTKPSTGNQQITCIEGNSRVFRRFLSWQLWARSEEIREVAPYTTLPILNNDFLRSLAFFAPPLEAQREIADQLDQIAGRDTLALRHLNRQITLLEESRSALITAAVTGEIDVPTPGHVGGRAFCT